MNSIYRRLMLTLGALVALTLAVGTVGWVGFTSTESTLETAQAESMADLRQVMTLAERSASLAAKAPTIADVRTPQALAEGRKDLEARLAEFMALAASLRSTKDPVSPARVPSIVRLADRLEGIVVNLIAVTGEGLDARRRLGEHRLALVELSDRLVEAEALLPSLPDPGRASRAVEAARRALSAARAGMIAADTPSVDDARADFVRSAANYRRLAMEAGPGTDPSALAAMDTAIQALGDLFAARRLEISANLRIRIFLAAVDTSSTHLTSMVRGLAATVEQAALARGERSAEALRRGKMAMLLFAGLCLVAALVAASTLMRDVVTNLRGATSALTRLAAGDFGAEAPGAERPDEIGELARAFAVFRAQAIERDEFARREAENAARLTAIFDNMTGGLALFDRDGRLKTWNPSFVSLSGLAADHVQTGAALDHLLEDLFGRGVETRSFDGRALGGRSLDLARLARSRAMQSVVLEQHYPDGTVVEIRTNAMPNGEWLASLFDLTDRKMMERQLGHAQRMEAIGQLTGGIAHDFNNVLAAISGNLQMIIDESELGSTTRTRALRALDAAESGGATTQRLLAFARRQPLEPEPTDLNTLVADVADLLVYGLGAGIDIALSLDDDLPPAMIDPERMETALINLIFNARDSISGPGRITIATEAAPDGGIRLSVRDTGSGMAPEVAARAFEPFFTTKPFGAGSGLGLSMVYGFVRQSGGSIAIDSEVGNGTVMTVTLPAASAEAEAEPETFARVMPPPSGAHVLVVEDDPRVRPATAELVASLGYRVTDVATAEAALAVLDRDVVDLLFTDVSLGPGPDGPALAGLARAHCPGLPVVYCSGFPRGADLDGTVLDKPFRRDRLAAALAAALQDQPEPIGFTSASNT
ncbi:ATP-binding protein [Chthonobacter albigriseus]|uniref:ATP-binding protein n=1 Tax=Chthonobacter albigriseus TaxID=1683161 RepID=UPI0015EE5C4B